MTLHPRRRAWFGQWPTILWLAVAWTMLGGDLTWANILGGLALGVVVTLVFPLPAIGFHVRVRPVSLLWLVVRFLWDLVRASFQVAFQALHVTRVPRGAVIGALVYEGMAKTAEEAEKLAASGQIEYAPCHEHSAVGPMAGIVSASMPVFIIKNPPVP